MEEAKTEIKKINKKMKQFVVIGLGRFGRSVATTLADLGNITDAIKLLQDDYSKNALLMKSEFYWKNKEWGKASDTIRHLIDQPQEGKELSEEQIYYILGGYLTTITGVIVDNKGIVTSISGRKGIELTVKYDEDEVTVYLDLIFKDTSFNIGDQVTFKTSESFIIQYEVHHE